MGHYVETDRIGKVWVSDVDDWFASLSNLISECRNYTVCETRFQEILKEHDAKVIDDFLNEALKLKIYKQVFVDDLRMVAEQMKEKKDE